MNININISVIIQLSPASNVTEVFGVREVGEMLVVRVGVVLSREGRGPHVGSHGGLVHLHLARVHVVAGWVAAVVVAGGRGGPLVSPGREGV